MQRMINEELVKPPEQRFIEKDKSIMLLAYFLKISF